MITDNAEGRPDGQRGPIWRETHQTVQIGIEPYANQWRKGWWRQRRDVSSWPFDNQDFQPSFFFLSPLFLFSPPTTHPHRKRCIHLFYILFYIYIFFLEEKNVSTTAEKDDDSLTWKNERRKRERECEGGKRKSPRSLHLFLSLPPVHIQVQNKVGSYGLIRLCSQRSPKVYYNNTTRRRNSSTGGHSIRPFSSLSLSSTLSVFLCLFPPKELLMVLATWIILPPKKKKIKGKNSFYL